MAQYGVFYATAQSLPQLDEELDDMRRRDFLALLGAGCGSAMLPARPALWALSPSFPDGKEKRNLYNPNFQAALGLGDERASILNYAGELRSRNALARWVLPGGDQAHPDQQLQRGYLPIVQNRWKRPGGTTEFAAYAARWNEHGGYFIDLLEAPEGGELQAFFPYTLLLELNGSVLRSGARVLLAGLPDSGVTLDHGFDPGAARPTHQSDIHGIKQFLNYGLEHRFPANAGKPCFLYWAIAPTSPVPAGDCWLHWRVNDEGFIVLPSAQTRQHPLLHRFDVTPVQNEVRFQCDPDPAVMASKDYALEHSVWLFDEKIDELALTEGELDSRALARIPWEGELRLFCELPVHRNLVRRVRSSSRMIWGLAPSCFPLPNRRLPPLKNTGTDF